MSDTYQERRPAEVRFWEKVDKQPNGCWIWTGNLTAPRGSGYGRFHFQGRMHTAHRFAYELLIGTVPDGLELDHLCRVRDCVNPAHLEPVTPLGNKRRGIVGENSRSKTHCPAGHAYDEENTSFKLTRGIRQRVCRTCDRARMRNYQREVRAGLR